MIIFFGYIIYEIVQMINNISVSYNIMQAYLE